MYPKLRPDIYIAESREGAVVVVDGRSTHLKGKPMAALLERLLPHLDGTRSLAELVAELPDEKGRIVRQLVELMARVGAIRDASEDRRHVLEEALKRTYAPSLGYLETLGEGATRRFLQVRGSRVIILGGGAAVRTLASGLWEAGVRRGVVVLPPGDAHAAPLQGLLEEHGAVDPDLDWRIETQGEPASAVAAELLRESRLVIAVGSAEALDRMNERCLALEVAWLPVVLARGYGFIGPWVRPGEPGCLACARSRVEPAPPERPADDNGWSFLGARAAVEAFKGLADLPVTCEQALIRIDGEELTDTVHALHRVGDCAACAREDASAPEIMPWPADEPDLQALPAAAEAWIDAFGGVLSGVDPEDWSQLPLCLWAARGRSLDDITLLLPGKDHDSARLRCVLTGLCAALPELPPDHAARLLLPREPEGDLTPAGPPAGPVSWCRAAGWSLGECVGQGLLSLAQQAMRPALQGRRMSAQALEAALDEESSFWWKTLSLRYDVDAEAWCATHPSLPVVAVEVCAGGAPLSLAAGRTLAEALKTSLMAALGAVQAREARGAEARFHLGAPGAALRVEPSVAAPAPRWRAWLQSISGHQVYLALDPRNAPLRASGVYLGWIGLRRDTR